MIINSYNNQLSREHIKYVLGVNISLNESAMFTEAEYKLIIERQLIYETFLDDLKAKIGNVANKTVSVIKDLKDFFVTMARVLSNRVALNAAIDITTDSLKELVEPVTSGLIAISDEIKQLSGIDIKRKIESYVSKISSITAPWLKFVSTVLVGSSFTWLELMFKSLTSMTNTVKSAVDYGLNSMGVDKGELTGELKDNILSLLDELGVFSQNSIDILLKSAGKFLEFSSDISSLARISRAVYIFTQPVAEKLSPGFNADGTFTLPNLSENINDTDEVVCNNCGHDWKIVDGGKDTYLCHICGQDNTPSKKHKSKDMEELHEGEFCPRCLIEYILEHVNTLEEAEYKGRKVQLGKPFLTPNGPKKRSVYVKNKKGNIVKINFGDPNMRIKKSNPKRRKSFRARHKCHTANDRTTPRYWSCRAW